MITLHVTSSRVALACGRIASPLHSRIHVRTLLRCAVQNSAFALAVASAIASADPAAAQQLQGPPPISRGILTSLEEQAPDGPRPWKYVAYQPEPAEEQKLRDSVAAVVTSDADLKLVNEALDLAKDRAPATYRFLIRASLLPSGDPEGAAKGLWTTLMLMGPSRGVPMLSGVYHEYTHIAQGIGTADGPLGPDNTFFGGMPVLLRLYPMDDYWVGVPDVPALMPVREAYADVADPQPFDRMYLESFPAGNNLFTMLGELQAYTRQAELEMALYDRVQPVGARDTRFSLLRTLYQLDVYLGHLHDAYPDQWDTLTASPAVPYLVKGLTERAWSVDHQLDNFPNLGFNADRTKATTRSHTDNVTAFTAASGTQGPVALDPHRTAG